MKYTLCSELTKPENRVVPSQKGEGVYVTSLSTPLNDASCTCPGFTFRGICKHIAEAEDSRCRWVIVGDSDLENCPRCGRSIDTWGDRVDFI